ncbi:MAG: hypothetical protein EZS28_039008, partial [Streblomastix strix]
GGSCVYDTNHSFDEKMAYNRAIINDMTSAQNVKRFVIILVGLAYSFVDPMAYESDEDTRLELMEQFDEEVEDIIKDVKKMTSETPSTRQIGSNNENFTIGSYNGFEIMIRDSDGFINATKLVQQINEREHTTKELRNITRSPVFVEYKQYLEKISPFNLNGPLCYLLPTAFMNDVRGTYVHKQLLNIICIKSSVKYLHHVTTIMDKINETVIAEHKADNTQAITDQFHNVIDIVTDTLSARVTKLNEKNDQLIEENGELREQNNELNTDVRHLQNRAVPKGKQRSFCLIVEEVRLQGDQNGDQIKIQIRRKMKKTISRGLMEYYKHDTLLFIDNLPIATTINEVIKEEFTRRDGMKIKGTKYTFPYDQLDDIIERIKQIVIEVQDV